MCRCSTPSLFATEPLARSCLDGPMLVTPPRTRRVLEGDRERLREVGAAMLGRMLWPTTRADRPTLEVWTINAGREIDALAAVVRIGFGGCAERAGHIVALAVGRAVEMAGRGLLRDCVFLRHRGVSSETGTTDCRVLPGHSAHSLPLPRLLVLASAAASPAPIAPGPECAARLSTAAARWPCLS